MKRKLGLLAALILTASITVVKADTESSTKGPCEAPWTNVCYIIRVLNQDVPVKGVYTYRE